MKRNRKAEAAKKKRMVGGAEAERKWQSVLLTELAVASKQILVGEFGFTEERVGEFLEKVWLRLRAMTGPMPMFDAKKRMGVMAQRFGLAATGVLREGYEFTGEQADRFLVAMIARGKKNRVAVADPHPNPLPLGEGTLDRMVDQSEQMC